MSLSLDGGRKRSDDYCGAFRLHIAVGEKERCDKFGRDLNQSVLVKNLGQLRWWDASSRGIGRRGFVEFSAIVH